MKEQELKAAILQKFGCLPDIRLFNNPVGEAWVGKTVLQKPGRIVLDYPRRIRFGLAPGSSDLIGFRTLIVDNSMIGTRIAQFLAVEVKTSTGRATGEQRNFLRIIEAFGGTAVLARGVNDVEEAVEKS